MLCKLWHEFTQLFLILLAFSGSLMFWVLGISLFNFLSSLKLTLLAKGIYDSIMFLIRQKTVKITAFLKVLQWEDAYNRPLFRSRTLCKLCEIGFTTEIICWPFMYSPQLFFFPNITPKKSFEYLTLVAPWLEDFFPVIYFCVKKLQLSKNKKMDL